MYLYKYYWNCAHGKHFSIVLYIVTEYRRFTRHWLLRFFFLAGEIAGAVVHAACIIAIGNIYSALAVIFYFFFAACIIIIFFFCRVHYSHNIYSALAVIFNDLHTHTHKQTHTRTHTHTHTHTCIYIHNVFIYTYIYMYIYVYGVCVCARARARVRVHIGDFQRLGDAQDRRQVRE